MIVIVGATGTIGSALVERLADLGVPVRALSREPEKLRKQIGEKGPISYRGRMGRCC
ncbi:NmrA family NAD(P)-binding protein [Paenibacillus rhizoplanae]